MLSRFLLAVVRNCGVAITISVFFAVARTPSQPPRADAVHALAAATASFPGPAAHAGLAPGCERLPGRVCRLVDGGQPTSASAP